MKFSVIQKNLASFLLSNKFHISLILLGSILRLKHYLENRPLWIDEAYVAVGITARSWQELIFHQPIFPDQAKTPLGFALFEKLSILTFGDHEFALRFLPFLSGIGAIIIFYLLLKRYVSPAVVSIALGIFILSDTLVYYSAEVKPYATDVFLMLLIFWLAEFIIDKRFSILRFLLFAFAGAIAVWTAFSSVFVLAGVGLVLGFVVCMRRQWKILIALGATYSFWLANFIIMYKLSISQMMGNQYLWSFHIWKTSVLSTPIISLASVTWLKDVFLAAIKSPVGLAFPALVAVYFLLGCFTIFKRDKIRFFLLLAPILLTLIAAMFKKYPFGGRLIMFTVPIMVIFIGEGSVWLIQKSKKLAPIVAIAVIALLFFHPIKTSAYYFTHDRSKEDMRSIMQHYKDNFKPGDAVIVNDFALPQFLYYISSLKCNYETSQKIFAKYDEDLVEGYKIGHLANEINNVGGPPFVRYREILCIYNKDGYLRKFLGDPRMQGRIYEQPIFRVGGQNRTWVILPNYQPEYKEFLLKALDGQGKKVEEFEEKGSSIYLYDLRV